jgi:chloramphenicol 3-O phosphotransferase
VATRRQPCHRHAGALRVPVPTSSLPPGGRIVLLNGTSSSGKTSLAKAMQNAARSQYLHLQLNAFRDMEPVGYFNPAQPELVALRVAALCRAMYAAVLEFAAHGQDIIFDHVLSPDAWRYFFEDFEGVESLHLIGVHCPIEELARRERARGDREPGLAQSQIGSVHRDRSYDFEVDTSRAAPAECAGLVLDWLERNPVPTAFDKMRARRAVA